MARYSGTVRDQYQKPVIGALVAVTTQAGATAALTDDDDNTLDNPLTTDGYGVFYFNAADGLYDLSFIYGGRTVTKEYGVLVGDRSAIPLGFVTWAELEATTGVQDGELAIVAGDSGTHIDPVSEEEVPNDGVYSWTGTAWAWMAAVGQNIDAGLWTIALHVDAVFATTAGMAAASTIDGEHMVVNDDDGTFPGPLDGWLFPAEGRYLKTGGDIYWARTLEQASTDERFDAVFTQNELHARSNLSLTAEIIGKEVTGTIDSDGSGLPAFWQRWDITNVDGGEILQIKQNGADWFRVSGFYPEIILYKSGRPMRHRAASSGYGWELYAATDTVSGEPAQLYTIAWNDSAHVGPSDNTSVIEMFWGNGAGGRTAHAYPGAWTTSFKRMEIEGAPGYPGYLPIIGYEAASSLGRTMSFENSGQATEFAGDSVNRPIMALRNYQTTNGLWLATWGTNTTPNAWAKSDGMFRVTSLEMPEGTPSDPPANSLRLYAVDVAGVTKLAYRDSAGTETIL